MKSFWKGFRIVFIPPSSIGGAENVLGICPIAMKVGDIVSDSESLVIMASNRMQAADLKRMMMQSRSSMSAIAGLLGDEAVQVFGLPMFFALLLEKVLYTVYTVDMKGMLLL